MTDNPGQAAPGWYPDPGGSPRQRYFDGEVWTDHYHDDAAQAPGAPMGAPAGAAMGAAGGYAAQGAAQPAMNAIDYWKKVVLENYVNFSGRARRAEFWWYTLVNFGISIVLAIIGGIIGFDLLGTLFSLAVLLPSIAVGIRRLHDTNRSGWWLLIGLIPLIGFIILIVFFATDGDRGHNEHGPSPKYA